LTTGKFPEQFRIGTDIGGTFTDIVFSGSKGTVLTKKILSTPEDYSQAIAQGVDEVLKKEGIEPAAVTEVVHGTTIVTNTCIELTGAKVGLITTAGFRDILEIARGRMPELYNLAWNKPTPMVPRYLRFEVEERIGKKGEILRELNEKQVEDAVDKLAAEGVEAVAICFFNSPLNASHEVRAEEIVRKRAPHLYVCISTKIRPMLKEYERTSETVVNAYVMPVVTTYLKSLKASLSKIGVNTPLYVMQSSGGMISAEEASEVPVEIVECGPAAGVVGAAHLSQRQNIKDIITLDLGGTTTKASVVESGRYTRSAEYEVGAGIHRASRLHKGKGYVLRIPSIDIAEIGAGGGSIVWMDKGGLMNVGPRSAGASPGPICYNKGGEDPTLTDSYVILGYMNPSYLLSGDFVLNAEKARNLYEQKVACPLRRELADAAYGAYEIANSNIRRAITSVSSERGRDPRKFSLFVFGGAGALHGAAVARSIGMKEVIIAPLAGIFSAYGLLCADIQRNYVKAYDGLFEASALAGINHAFGEMIGSALRAAHEYGHPASSIKVAKYADLRYQRQQSEITMAMPADDLQEGQLKSLYEDFHKEYETAFGFRLSNVAIEVVNLRVSTTIAIAKPATSGFGKTDAKIAKKTGVTRQAFFGPAYGTMQVPVAGLDDITTKSQKGPMLIDTYDSTIVVPPASQIKRSASGNLTITLQ
jgi:N-methylhydantoinase A